jgi:hypothetical protein
MNDLDAGSAAGPELTSGAGVVEDIVSRHRRRRVRNRTLGAAATGVDRLIVSGRRIPVLPLPAMQVMLDATGKREQAAMVAKVLGGKPGGAGT